MRPYAALPHAGAMTETPLAPAQPTADHARWVTRIARIAAALSPLVALAGTFWLGLYAVHNLDVRRGADWTGLGFGEFFLWGVAVVMGLGVLATLGVLLLVRRTRTTPPLLALGVSGAVALAGLAFSGVAWSIVTDSSLIRQRSIEWGTPFVIAGALLSLVPLVVAGPWWGATRLREPGRGPR